MSESMHTNNWLSQVVITMSTGDIIEEICETVESYMGVFIPSKMQILCGIN